MIQPKITAPFNNMQTLKFKVQPTIMLFTLSITAADLLENNNVWLTGVKRSFFDFVGFCFFCAQLVVAIIMIDSSKTCKSLVGGAVMIHYPRQQNGLKLLRIVHAVATFWQWSCFYKL